MSPSLQTMGFFMSDINFCNTKEQLNHLGEVVTGKVDGSPTGADIDTSTLPYTGQVRKTLPALEDEYEQSITDKEAEADAAIDSYRLLNKGPYASGITLESKFEYITYNGESYFALNPPYTTTATTPDADGNLFIGGYVNEPLATQIAETVLEENISTYTDIVYKASGGNSAVENMIAGIPISVGVGAKVCTGGTSWIKVSSENGNIDDFKPINDLYLEDWCLNTPTSSNDNTYGWVEINDYIKNDGAGDGSSFAAINLGADNNFKISAGAQIPLGVYVLKSDGYSKITPDVTLVAPFTVLEFNVGAHINISGTIFNQFDTGCTAIGGRTWRQSTIYDSQFIGGYGVDLLDNNWGTTIEKCRFTSVDGGIKSSIGGQTFQVINCLFFNSKEYDLKSESVTIGSELLVSGCVFESGDGELWPGKTAILEGVKEVKFIGCQSERLKGIAGLTDVKLSYDMIITNSSVEFDNCKFWGGIWNGLEGSLSSSRAYGLYLDNSTLKLNNSRLYSFHKRALRCENGSTVSTDVESQVDFRSAGGEPIFMSSTDLGENWITNGDFVYTYDNSIPVSFDRFNNVGQVRTTDPTEPCNAARLDLTSSNAPTYSNWIDVSEGEWVSWRFLMEALGYVNYRVRNQSDVAIFEKTNLVMNAAEDNKALVCNSVQIPVGTTRIRVEYPNGSIVEGMALYRNIKLKVTSSGSLYSTNDSTNGCDVDMTCPLPFKKSTRELTSIQQGAGSLFTGPWSGGEKILWDSPSSISSLGLVRVGGSWFPINWS